MKRAAVLLLILLAACGGTATTSSSTTTAPAPDALAAPTTTIVVLPPTAPPADMLNPEVTQATIATTICKRGWTATIRPPVAYTEPLKRLQIRSYGYTDQRLSRYEEDHAIPLELGGAPTARANLWPEPHSVSVPDDGLEGSLNSRVCKGTLSLADARAQMYAVKLSHGFDRGKSTA